MKEIVVIKRENDFHACLREDPYIWGNGQCVNQAIGEMISKNPDKFQITIKVVSHETAV